VYYERVDASPPAIAAIRTDVAGFVGLAPRGPLDTAVPVQSWRQYQAHFGGFSGAGFLAYAVRAFFENGGRRCWVVRVASREPNGGARAAAIVIQDAKNKDVWRIEASSPGVWGNGLTVTLRETHRAQTTTDPTQSTPDAAKVASISGFERATLVQLSQDVGSVAWKVVSDVDPLDGRLLWVHPDPRLRMPYDRPLTGFDPGRAIAVESVEYTLLVREAGSPLALFEGLSLVPEHANYGPHVVAPLDVPLEFEVQRRLPAAPRPIVVEEQRERALLAALAAPQPIHSDALDKPLSLRGGRDGLALLRTYDWIGEEISPQDSDVVQARKRRGVRALETVNEISVVAVPDVHVQPRPAPAEPPRPSFKPDPCLPGKTIPAATPSPPPRPEQPPVFTDEQIYRVQATLVARCEALGDRFALLAPPFAAARADQLGIGAVRAWRSRFDSTYAALTYPWLQVTEGDRPASALTRDVPPCGHVAGQYAHTDFAVGVHKAPANEALRWALDVTVPVDDAVHAILNGEGINVIRPLPGRGIRVMGARTVSSDPSWRYVNVRRLLIMIEEAIYLSTQWAAFEPNSGTTRTKLRLSLLGFLLALWRRGALIGETPGEAFYVQCDEGNNPPGERDRGRLWAEVGVAPSQPFEFVVLRVGRTGNEFEVFESSMMKGDR
jgi:phage tail sheath protein FI